MTMTRLRAGGLAVILALLQGAAALAEDASDLAKQLSNPISSLVSVPFQYNYNTGFLDGTASQSYINIQPVIPFSIGENWNLISRTILPVISQNGFQAGGNQNGFGNTVQSFFFSPKNPTSGGLIWGVGPVIQIPTVTNDLGPSQWGLGLTGVALKQANGWTYGALVNHVWSVSKNDFYGESSASFLQPFVSYTTPKATSFTLNTESTYNWVNDTWSVPINAMVGQIVKIGGKPVQLTGGVRYWAETPDGGPTGWGARLAVTYLFPKG